MKMVFMSGDTPDVIAQRGARDEGVDFIQKPFSMVELGQKLADALGRSPRVSTNRNLLIHSTADSNGQPCNFGQ